MSRKRKFVLAAATITTATAWPFNQPHPLGIGTLELDDGTRVKGFLCEPVGLTHAQDISNFGGW